MMVSRVGNVFGKQPCRIHCLKTTQWNNIASQVSYFEISKLKCLFAFIILMSAVCLHNVSCLITFMVPLSAGRVTLWYHCQLFVYIYGIIFSYLFTLWYQYQNLAFEHEHVKWDIFGDFQALCYDNLKVKMMCVCGGEMIIQSIKGCVLFPFPSQFWFPWVDGLLT